MVEGRPIAAAVISLQGRGFARVLTWKGKLVEAGPPELFASQNDFVRQFLNGESLGLLGRN